MAGTPIQFAALDVIEDAFLDLGITAPGESLDAVDAQFALRTLNRLVSTLALSPLSFPFIDREVFDVVALQSTYTIGPGGNFNTVRPTSITGAGLLLPSAAAATGAIEIPRGVLTTDEYQAIAAKDLQSPLWTSVYYDPTYADGFGAIFLWPTPTTTTYDLVLYRGDAIQGFANLTTLYDFPPGYAEMLQYNLEKRMCRSYGKAREWGALDDELARDSLALVKRQNFRLRDTMLDPAMTHGRRGGYNIELGNG